MAYKQPSSGSSFKMMGSSPAKKDTDEKSNINTEQKTYEKKWQESASFINLTKAGAPAEVLEKAKNKWSGLNETK